MQSNGLNIQDVSLPSLAVNMISFYHGIIRKNLVLTDPNNNKKTLSKLRKMYTKKLRNNDPCTISFDSVDVRCAYLHQFCPSFTLAVANHFLAFLKKVSSQHVHKLALQESLTVCCLGGGPATEIVAICAVLGEVRKQWTHQNGKLLLIDVIIVDSEKGWSTTAKEIVDSIYDLVPQSLVKINSFRFVQADLTKDISEDIQEVLGRSQMVTMTKFLSAIHGSKDAETRNKILQDTTTCMPVGSFLYILDSSGWLSIDAMTKTVGSFAWMESLYGPCKKTSRMSKSSKKLCVLSFSDLYGSVCCTLQSMNKVTVWWKKSPTSCNGTMS